MIGVTDGAQIALIKGVHAYNDALRDGASLWAANAVEAATVTLELAKQAQIRKEADQQRARSEASSAAQKAGGDTTGVTSKGYASFIESPLAFAARAAYGPGGYAVDEADLVGKTVGMQRIIPNAQGLETLVNKGLRGGGGIGSQIDQLLGKGSGLTSQSVDLVQTTAQMLSRLTNRCLMTKGALFSGRSICCRSSRRRLRATNC